MGDDTAALYAEARVARDWYRARFEDAQTALEVANQRLRESAAREAAAEQRGRIAALRDFATQECDPGGAETETARHYAWVYQLVALERADREENGWPE